MKPMSERLEGTDGGQAKKKAQPVPDATVPVQGSDRAMKIFPIQWFLGQV